MFSSLPRLALCSLLLPALTQPVVAQDCTGIWMGSQVRVVVYECGTRYCGILEADKELLPFVDVALESGVLAGNLRRGEESQAFTFAMEQGTATLKSGGQRHSLKRTQTDPYVAVGDRIDAKDYASAWAHIGQLVERHVPHALYVAGLMHQNGWGTEQNLEQANAHYKLAVAKGSVFAPNNLGVSYRDGRGVAKDLAKALELFQCGALRGNSQAALNAGALLLNGNGIAVDMPEGCAWLALSNDEAATEALGRLLPKLSAEQRQLMDQRVRELKSQREKVIAPTLPGSVAMTIAMQNGKPTVRTVADGSQAQRSGIEVGDVLLEIDGQPVAGSSLERLQAKLEGESGSLIQLRFDRSGTNVQVAMPREAQRK